MTHSAVPYIMDDPREAQRLSAKVDPDAWIDVHLAPLTNGACHILDVGCGSGAITSALAKRSPHSAVVGFDASADRLAEATRRSQGLANFSVQQGVATALPFGDESFDLVYSRFLLEYLPDRQDAVAEMVRVCRSGGRVLLHDLDGQLLWHYPPEEPLQSDIERVLATLAATGFNPFAGRTLFSLARRAGLQDVSVRIDPYHVLAGTPSSATLALWELKLDIARPIMVQALGSAVAADDLRRRFLAYLVREDTLTYSVLFTVSGKKVTCHHEPETRPRVRASSRG